MKKILFLNTTKLAVLSAMLLLAVFCTIGMSFTPAEEGENVGNPNDSTYVTGPRRSHWTTTTSCMGQNFKTNHNETDYAQVAAVVKVYDESNIDITSSTTNIGQVTLENISTSTETGTVDGSSLSGNETTSAYINWNSSKAVEKKESQIAADTIAAAHKLKVKFTAECIDEGYNFVGWYKAEGMSDSDFKEGAAEFSEVICIGGGTTPGVGYGSYAEGEANKKTTYTTGARYTVTYYACFKPKANVTVTLKAAENGSYTYADGTNSGTITSTDGSIETKSVVTLQASPATGYKFFGWYEMKDGKETYFSYESSTEKTFPTDATIYAKFIPKDAALFIIKEGDGTEYWNLNEACIKAQSSLSKVVLPTKNGTLYPLVDGELCTSIPAEKKATDYTIPSEVTLYIPYSENSAPKGKDVEIVKDEDFVKTNCKVYRKLTLAEGVTIDVCGNIEVAAQQVAKGQSSTTNQGNNGAIYQGYGEISMSKDSYINLENKAFLYAWGRITGSPESRITANLGSTVYESFQITDFQGGTRTTAMYNGRNDYKIFPFSQYYIQNIEVPLRIRHGAKELVNAALVASSVTVAIKDLPIIGNNSAMFTTTAEDSYVEKMYDETKDRQIFKINGNATLTNFSFTYSSYTIKTVDFLLPLTNNMDIYLERGTVNLDANVILTADANVVIRQGVTVNLKSNVFVYDQDDWKTGFVFQNKIIAPLKYTIPYNNVRTTVSDATIQVDGELIVTGNLYVSPNKANICSTGTGKVSFPNGNTCSDNYTVHHLKETRGSLMFASVSTTYETSFIPAQLHNDETKNPDYHYTQTSDAVADDEFLYVESLGKWVKKFGPELDIVDADNTKKTLTINANGWASSGWPYTVDGVKYDKGDREDDRTLIIPYNGTAGASLPIAVLDKDGKPICRHIYKVPFVYTGTEDMSDMNENSIVFVKSGTLTVGTASAKEIYVADSAELKVTGTLTVGKLVLRTTPYKAAVLTNNGTINGQVYYSRISPDAKQYYQFGLPLSCALANVKMSNTGKLGGSQPKYGTAWVLKSYSESLRAQNGISKEGANWVSLENTNNTGVITAGVGYEMFSNSNYYREFYFPVDLTTATNKVSVQYTDGTIAEHNGWNIITSPLTSRANVPIIDPATDFKVCWLNEDGSYRQELPTVFPPAIPFSIQASAGGELNFAVPTIAAAPRKQSAAEALTETEWVHLDIFDAYGEGDETSLFIHPTRFEQTYKTGIDMAKQSLTASRAILYTTHAYGDMAFAGVADSLLENGIDLIVYSPAEQELTISLRENAFLNRLEYLWLADNETGARTDLLMNDYTFRADAGTIKGRFVLNGRFKAPQISTGIGNTQTDYNIYAIGNNIAISGVELGTPIYVFDAVGHMIYTTAATSDEVIVPAPCAGVYMLSVGGQTAKLVINK